MDEEIPWMSMKVPRGYGSEYYPLRSKFTVTVRVAVRLEHVGTGIGPVRTG